MNNYLAPMALLATVIRPGANVDTVNAKGRNGKVLQKILARVLSVTRPEKVIVFGSAARGDAGPESDIDILVIARVAHRRRTAQKIYRRLIGVGAAVDVVVATPGDLKKYGDRIGTIFPTALEEGKVIYAA